MMFLLLNVIKDSKVKQNNFAQKIQPDLKKYSSVEPAFYLKAFLYILVIINILIVL